ncbi:DUF3800 domain-containing protein [Occultella kanbiaonis]|uniref:DUF3800 domain-containing protein n=1 Tax=Occultella kanbiaonis TaxID=2675754 RepID=UPI0013D86A67|nr:DUF3800 domain-containing protein [Occultella kanbiaonis]
MLLAYVDESYTRDFFYLGALVVDSGEQAREIETGLDLLIEEFRTSGAAQVSRDVELHGKEIFHGQDGWANVPVRVRIAIYRRAMTLVRQSGARVVIRGMDCARQRARYARPDPPHEVVLAHLLESLNGMAAKDRDHVLVVADEVHTSERHRTNFRNYREWGTPGYTPSTLNRILDTIHFAPSHHSRLLQASDLITYLYRRRKTNPEPNAKAQAATDSVWSEIAPSVRREWTWRP